MIWSRVLLEVAKLAALFVVVPVILMVGLRWDAILPIIIYLQLLLIWIQAEISLRQTALFAAQFEPAFDVKFTDTARTTLSIENVSENPAYNLSVIRLLDESGTPFDPNQWQDKLELGDRMASLAPHEKRILCVLKDQSLRERLMTRGTLEVSYFGRQGEIQTFTILFRPEQLSLYPAPLVRRGRYSAPSRASLRLGSFCSLGAP